MALGGQHPDPFQNMNFGVGLGQDGQGNLQQGLPAGGDGIQGGLPQHQRQAQSQPQFNVPVPQVVVRPPEDTAIEQQNLLIINEQLRNRLRDHAKIIGECDGSNKANLKSWVKAIDRAKKYCDAADNQIIDLVGTLATGALAEAIGDYLSNTDELEQTWEQVQGEINRAYLSEEEQLMQRNAIKELYQIPYEDVQAYGRNFKIKVSQAYPEGSLNNVFVQESLISQYISGIKDEKIKFETFSKRPKTFKDAIRIADAVAHTLKMVAAKSSGEDRVEEPMDISAVAAAQAKLETTHTKQKGEEIRQMLNDMKALKGQFESQVQNVTNEYFIIHYNVNIS